MSILSALLNSGKVYNFEQAFGAKDLTSKEMVAALKEWYDLFYDQKPHDGEDPCQRIPVVIVNKLTKTTFSEYTATPSMSSEAAPFIQAVLDGLGGARKKAMQQSLIGGVVWLKPLLNQDGTVNFNVVTRGNVVILARDDMDNVTSIGTAERTVQKDGYYTLLERRTVDSRGYLTIENKLFRSRHDEKMLGVEVPLDSLEKYVGLVPVYTYTEPVGSLGLIPVRCPLENCVDGSPDPVSIYAPAVGLIHNINVNEAQLNGEFERGESRIMASADLFRKGKNGEKIITDHVFTALDDDPESVGITIFSPALREASFLARKTEYLRNVETLIGLKRGLLSEVEASERTAKEITSSEGDYNLTIIDFQEMWEKAVREAVRVCSVLGKLYKVYTGPEIDPTKDVIVSWGNGILYDEDKVWQELKEMVAEDLLKAEIAVGWYFDMPTETEADLAKIREKYMPEIDKMAGRDGDDV